jgi:hypothetical protein
MPRGFRWQGRRVGACVGIEQVSSLVSRATRAASAARCLCSIGDLPSQRSSGVGAIPPDPSALAQSRAASKEIAGPGVVVVVAWALTGDERRVGLELASGGLDAAIVPGGEVYRYRWSSPPDRVVGIAPVGIGSGASNPRAQRLRRDVRCARPGSRATRPASREFVTRHNEAQRCVQSFLKPETRIPPPPEHISSFHNHLTHIGTQIHRCAHTEAHTPPVPHPSNAPTTT